MLRQLRAVHPDVARQLGCDHVELSELVAGSLRQPRPTGQPEQLPQVDRRRFEQAPVRELRTCLGDLGETWQHLQVLLGDMPRPARNAQRISATRRARHPQLTLAATLGQHRALCAFRQHVQIRVGRDDVTRSRRTTFEPALRRARLHRDDLFGRLHDHSAIWLNPTHQVPPLQVQQHRVVERFTEVRAITQLPGHDRPSLLDQHPQEVHAPIQLGELLGGRIDCLRLRQRISVLLHRLQRGLLVALINASRSEPPSRLGRQERIALLHRETLEISVVGEGLLIRLHPWVVDLNLDHQIVRQLRVVRIHDLRRLQRRFRRQRHPRHRDRAQTGVGRNPVHINTQQCDAGVGGHIAGQRDRALHRIVVGDLFREAACQHSQLGLLRDPVGMRDLNGRIHHPGTQRAQCHLGCGDHALRRSNESALVGDTCGPCERGARARPTHTLLRASQQPVDALLDACRGLRGPRAQPFRLQNRAEQLVFQIFGIIQVLSRGLQPVDQLSRALGQRAFRGEQIVHEELEVRIEEPQIQFRLGSGLDPGQAVRRERRGGLPSDQVRQHRACDFLPLLVRQLHRSDLRLHIRRFPHPRPGRRLHLLHVLEDRCDSSHMLVHRHQIRMLMHKLDQPGLSVLGTLLHLGSGALLRHRAAVLAHRLLHEVRFQHRIQQFELRLRIRGRKRSVQLQPRNGEPVRLLHLMHNLLAEVVQIQRRATGLPQPILDGLCKRINRRYHLRVTRRVHLDPALPVPPVNSLRPVQPASDPQRIDHARQRLIRQRVRLVVLE